MNASAPHLAHWAEIEPLLDQALALPAIDRERFLDTLPPDQQRWRGLLAELLRHEAQAARAGFLSLAASLPEFAASVADGAPASAATLLPGQVIGPWLLLEELGRGGMASVWLARRQEGDFQREVALKLPLSPAPSWADRFRRERDILARLSHSGIARLFDAGISPEGLPWLAMERVLGVDILAWCEQQAAGVNTRVALLLQIADALQYAHSQLVVHRDIKPANVLVQADGQVRLLDFGIARLLASGGDADPALTQLGQRPMTPEYASPEQVRGEEPGIASDVYALGVLGYRLLSGASPYAAAAPTSRHALERAVLETEPQAPSAAAVGAPLRKALHGDVDAIVLKALAKDPGQRYATIDAMAADLRRHLAGEPVLARAPTWRYRAGRFVARHRWAVGVSTVAVLALLGTTGWALAAARQARSETVRAEAIYHFALGLFNPGDQSSPDPSLRDMRLRDVVKAGSRRILDQLRDAPRERLGLITDLAKLASAFNLDEEAQRLHDEMVNFARQTWGATSVDYADTLINQTDWAYEHQRADQAISFANEAMRIYQARGVSDPDRLSNAYVARSAAIERFPAGDPHVESDLRASAHYAQQAGNFDQFHVTQGILARFHANANRYDLALKDVDEALASDRKNFGPESAQTLDSLRNRGDVLDNLGLLAASIATRREALAGIRHVWGDDHQQTVTTQVKLSLALLDARDTAEALSLSRQASAIVATPGWVSADGKKRDIAQFVQSQEIKVALRQGQVEQAVDLCRRYGPDGQQEFPANRVQRLSSCAFALVAQGDLIAAQTLLNQAEALRQKFWPGPVPRKFDILQFAQGELSGRRGHADDARARFRAVIAVNSEAPLRAAQAWLSLVMLAPAGLSDVDITALRSLVTQIERSPDRNFLATQEACLQEALGRVLVARGEAQAAIAPLTRAVALREQRGEGPDGAWLRRARQALATAQHAVSRAASSSPSATGSRQASVQARPAAAVASGSDRFGRPRSNDVAVFDGDANVLDAERPEAGLRARQGRFAGAGATRRPRIG